MPDLYVPSTHIYSVCFAYFEKFKYLHGVEHMSVWPSIGNAEQRLPRDLSFGSWLLIADLMMLIYASRAVTLSSLWEGRDRSVDPPTVVE